MRWAFKLIDALINNREETRRLRADIQRFIKEWRIRMATQEERLQAILTGVQDAIALIQDLRTRTDNQAINDELDAIEQALAGVSEPPAPEE